MPRSPPIELTSCLGQSLDLDKAAMVASPPARLHVAQTRPSQPRGGPAAHGSPRRTRSQLYRNGWRVGCPPRYKDFRVFLHFRLIISASPLLINEEVPLDFKASLWLLGALVGTSCVAASAANQAPPSASDQAPAIAAFDRTYAGITDYTCILHVRETKGTQTQDRLYQYSFMNPHHVKMLILTAMAKDRAGYGLEVTR